MTDDASADLPRRPAGWLLAALCLGTVLIRVLLNRYVPGPFIFNDELLYVELGRGFLEGRRMLVAGCGAYFPNWLYPILIAPLLASWPMPQAHQAILGLNAVLGALTVLPAYFWARELAGRRRALAAAALVGLLPGLGYSGVVMTECLFLLVMTTTLWLAYRAILRPTVGRCLLAGVAAGLGFHVKPHALLVPWVIALTVLWFESDRLRTGGVSSAAAWRSYLGALAPHAVTALAWAVGIAPRVLELAWLERPGEPLTLQTVLGAYFVIGAGTRPMTAWLFVASLAGYAVAWIFTTGLWPTWHLARELRASMTLRNERALRLMSELTTVATVVMLALVARHTLAADDTWRLHERYFFVIVPPVLILFATRSVETSAIRRVAPRLAALVGLGAALGWMGYLTRWTALTDSPTLSGLSVLMISGHPLRAQFAAGFVAVGALALGAWLFGGGRAARLATVVLLLVWFNLGWYLAQDAVNRRFLDAAQSLASRVGDGLPPDDRLLILYDGLPVETIWQVQFRTPGQTVAFDVNGLRRCWPSPIKLAADLRVLSPYAGERTWLLASRRWRFNKEPVRTVDNLALYRLSDPPLRLDPTQPLPASVTRAPI